MKTLKPRKLYFTTNFEKTRTEVLQKSKFKLVLLGEFNATIGMKSKVSGAWDNILGSNNHDLSVYKLEINEDDELLPKFCSESKMKS